MPPRQTRQAAQQSAGSPEGAQASRPEPKPPDPKSGDGNSGESPSFDVATSTLEEPSGASQLDSGFALIAQKLDSMAADAKRREESFFMSFERAARIRDERFERFTRQREENFSKLFTQLSTDIGKLTATQAAGYNTLEELLRKTKVAPDAPDAPATSSTDLASQPDEPAGSSNPLYVPSSSFAPTSTPGINFKGKGRAAPLPSQIPTRVRHVPLSVPSTPSGHTPDPVPFSKGKKEPSGYPRTPTPKPSPAPSHARPPEHPPEEGSGDEPSNLPSSDDDDEIPYKDDQPTDEGEANDAEPDGSRRRQKRGQRARQHHSRTRHPFWDSNVPPAPSARPELASKTPGYRPRTVNWRGLTPSWVQTPTHDDETTHGSSPWAKFQHRIHEGIDRVLNNTLRLSMTEPPSLQFVKTLSASTKPPSYEGEDDLATFMEWLQSLMTYYEIHQLIGRDADRLRVLVCGSALQGQAAHWYYLYFRQRSADSPGGHLGDVVHNLADRFITPAAAIRAQNNFERVRYSLNKGIRAFISDLEIYSSHMFQDVDEYTLRKLLLEAIPARMRNDLMDHKSLSTTTSPIGVWVEAIERREHELLERAAFNENETARNTAANVRASNARTTTRPMATRGPVTLPVKAALPPPAPRTGDRATPAGPPVMPRKPVPLADLKCHACGQKGHFKGSKNCPMTPKAAHLNVMMEDNTPADALEQILSQDTFDGVEYEGDPEYEEETEPGLYDDLDDYGVAIASLHIDEEQEDILLLAATTAASAEGDIKLADDLVRSVKEQYELRGSGQQPRPCGKPPKQLKAEAKLKWVSDPNIRFAHYSPNPTAADRLCPKAIIKIDGVEAYTCWDSGSELDAMSPDFTRAAGIDISPKDDTLKVRLGTKGSSSATSYLAKPMLEIGDSHFKYYLDVLNLDRYNAILGSLFCNRHKVLVDFDTRTIRFGKTVIKMLTAEEDSEMLRSRQTATSAPKNA